MIKFHTAAAAALCLSSAALADPPKPLSPAIQKLTEQVRQTEKSVAAATADADARARAEAMIEKAERFLRSRQDTESGGWSVAKPDKDGKLPPQGQFPAITALIVDGMLMDPLRDPAKDDSLKRGLKFLLSYQQSDGGIYDKILPNYNTAMSVSALAKVKSPEARQAVEKGVAFLKTLQWSEHSDPNVGGSEAPKPVTPDHPFYGGVGYGRHGRPDNSNLNMMMQALADAGVSPSDEAVKRALTFLKRTQMDDRINPEPFAKGSRQGGFVYATVEDAKSVDGRMGDSEAGKIDETLSDGTRASRLRAYGSMTYAGFKTYLYAELPRDDQRVAAALGWIRRNYTVDENPGMGADGQYYYYVVFARALRAWGEPTIKTLAPDGSPGPARHWRADLVAKLESLQNDDGSFKSVSKRWMEDNPDLIAGYALTALRQVVD